MSRKTLIVFIFGIVAGIGGAALAFNRVSHHHGNGDQAISLDQVKTTTPTPSEPAASLKPSAGIQADLPADAPAAEPERNGESDADTPAQADQNEAAASQSQPIVVPAGTTLTIRLGEELGSNACRVGQRFSATLDQDIVVHGQTVVPAGASVTGKVVSARSTGPLTGEANLQLKLTSVNVNNADLTVVTSTRSFGPKIKGKNKVGRFMKGLAKRVAGQEREVLLAEQSAYTFTLRRGLQVQ